VIDTGYAQCPASDREIGVLAENAGVFRIEAEEKQYSIINSTRIDFDYRIGKTVMHQVCYSDLENQKHAIVR